MPVLRIARRRKKLLHLNERRKRSLVKEELVKRRMYAEDFSKITVEAKRAFVKERTLIKRMNQFAAKDETLELFIGLYKEMRNQLGNLTGKKVLTISERSDFIRFLTEGEKANVTPLSFRGGTFQEMNLSHIAGKMDCIVANAVFERDAFFYTAMDFPASIRFNDRSENLKATVKERMTTLGKMREALKIGGKVIITGTSSKTMFKPQEIAQAGFRIIKLNQPDMTSHGRTITVFEKIK
ncbi:MAG: hypothetical protein WCW44_03780 [archaeon]|jgi:hypothetical protein